MQIRIEGIEEAIAELDDVATRMRDLTPVLTVAAQDTRTLIDDSFQNSRSPDDSPWRPLSERTLARRRGSDARILVDTARLRNSIQSTAAQRSLRFGTNVVYGGTHQFGRGRIPARPFFPAFSQGGSRFGLMTGGRAGVHWRTVVDDVAHYIRTGEIRP